MKLMNLNLEITQKKYEELCIDLWKKCIDKVEQTIKFAKINKKDFDEIILIGGLTRSPKIKKGLKIILMVNNHYKILILMELLYIVQLCQNIQI